MNSSITNNSLSTSPFKTIEQVIPDTGDMHIEAITTKVLLAPIKAVALTGKAELASRLQRRIKAILRYAVQQGLITYNPAQELGGVINNE